LPATARKSSAATTMDGAGNRLESRSPETPRMIATGTVRMLVEPIRLFVPSSPVATGASPTSAASPTAGDRNQLPRPHRHRPPAGPHRDHQLRRLQRRSRPLEGAGRSGRCGAGCRTRVIRRLPPAPGRHHTRHRLLTKAPPRPAAGPSHAPTIDILNDSMLGILGGGQQQTRTSVRCATARPMRSHWSRSPDGEHLPLLTAERARHACSLAGVAPWISPHVHPEPHPPSSAPTSWTKYRAEPHHNFHRTLH
jgi:hypothetical protein